MAGRSCWPNRGGDGAEVITDTDWGDRGLCKSADPDELFVEGAAQNRAKAVCTGCPVRTECLAYALDQRIEHGIWGGMTERERRALLRRRPTVTSWWHLLHTARVEHEQQTYAAVPAEDRIRVLHEAC
ncbi:WhiB family transcriptional regulator [Streptomyces canus]|uniref:WhiB family transcriptional regulator n=1 Tax=Streptomyces canus TaxID=58343 RepID=UPI002E2BBF27|nr:WhiB family transcriptional regulator [Streptomyces canus]